MVSPHPSISFEEFITATPMEFADITLEEFETGTPILPQNITMEELETAIPRFYSGKVIQDVNTFNDLVAEMGLNNLANWQAIADRLSAIHASVKSYDCFDCCHRNGLLELAADCEYGFQVMFEDHVKAHYIWAKSEVDILTEDPNHKRYPARPVIFCTCYGGVIKEIKDYRPNEDLWLLGATEGVVTEYHAPFAEAVVTRCLDLHIYNHPDWLDRLVEGSGEPRVYEPDYQNVGWKYERDELGGDGVADVGSG